MNIYEKAYELVELIKESDEVQTLKEAEGLMFGEESSRNLLHQYSTLQVELAKTVTDFDNMDEENKNKIADITMKMSQNEYIAKYLESQETVSMMLNQVIGIIGNALQEDTGGCSGSCTSCASGCLDF